MRHFRTCLIALALVLLAVGGACASGGSDQQQPAVNLFWRVLNAAVVIAIIWKLAGKQISSFFTGRRDGIAHELDSLEARKGKARQELMDVEKRIANLENERKAILADYEARGEALKAAIIAKAEESARNITAQAKQTAQNEMDNALAAFRDELADKIIDAASTSISGSLSEKDHEKLLNSFLNKVVLQ